MTDEYEVKNMPWMTRKDWKDNGDGTVSFTQVINLNHPECPITVFEPFVKVKIDE